MSGESIGKKQKKLIEILRVPHFSRTWNSLRDRSPTHGSDAFIIFANLLDFNIFSTIKLPDDIRLPRLIASCDQLPFGLMFQTGPRLLRPRHNSWIPISFSKSDQLLGNSSMKHVRPTKEDKLKDENLSGAILEVERSFIGDRTVLVLVCSENLSLPTAGADSVLTRDLAVHMLLRCMSWSSMANHKNGQMPRPQPGQPASLWTFPAAVRRYVAGRLGELASALLSTLIQSCCCSTKHR